MSERAGMREEVLYGNQQDHYDIFLTTYATHTHTTHYFIALLNH